MQYSLSEFFTNDDEFFQAFLNQKEFFVTPKDAQYLLQVGYTTIRRYIDDGSILALKVKGRIWIYRPSLLRLLKVR
jgi:hypothetical protein